MVPSATLAGASGLHSSSQVTVRDEGINIAMQSKVDLSLIDFTHKGEPLSHLQLDTA